MKTKENTNALGETMPEALASLEENKNDLLENFDALQLPELRNKKSEIANSIKEFPFVKIVDNATYELQKKSRTGVRTIRTTLQSEKANVLNRLKENILNVVSSKYDELIDEDVKPIEDEYQAEVTSWEDAKKAEKAGRDRIEESRKNLHRDNIQNFFTITQGVIESLDYEASKSFEILPKVNGEVVSAEYFEEFQDLFEGKVELLKVQLNQKKNLLQEKETLRLQQEKLAEQQKEAARIEGIKKSIDDFYTLWNSAIDGLTFDKLPGFQKSFDDEKGIDCQEFQPLYAEKRAALVKLIEARVKFIVEQEQVRLDQEALKKEKQTILISNRKTELQSIGFDADGAYDADGLKIIISEDDLLADGDDWTNFVNSVSEKISLAKIPVVIEEETVVEEQPLVADVEPKPKPHDIAHATEYKIQELQQKLHDYVNLAEYSVLFEMCKERFLI